VVGRHRRRNVDSAIPAADERSIAAMPALNP
jgi:hypothetical protein